MLLSLLSLFVGVCVGPLFFNVGFGVLSSLAIILLRKREMVTLL